MVDPIDVGLLYKIIAEQALEHGNAIVSQRTGQPITISATSLCVSKMKKITTVVQTCGFHASWKSSQSFPASAPSRHHADNRPAPDDPSVQSMSGIGPLGLTPLHLTWVLSCGIGAIWAAFSRKGKANAE